MSDRSLLKISHNWQWYDSYEMLWICQMQLEETGELVAYILQDKPALAELQIEQLPLMLNSSQSVDRLALLCMCE